MIMTDREYKKWVKQIVVEPVRKRWGDAWKMALTPEVRTCIVSAECFSIVRSWASTAPEVGVTEEKMEKLLDAARAEFGDELY